jgi:hypothetical protein
MGVNQKLWALSLSVCDVSNLCMMCFGSSFYGLIGMPTPHEMHFASVTGLVLVTSVGVNLFLASSPRQWRRLKSTYFCHLSACGHDNCFPGLLDGSIWNLVTELLRTLTIGWWDA